MATTRRTAGRKRPKGPSDLEVLFANLWSIAGDRSRRPVTEHKFHPTRRWRFDFAWPEAGVAVEIEGGSAVGGRHTRMSGFQSDAEKYNAAAELGWVVLRYTGTDLHKRGVQVIEQVLRVIEQRKKGGE